MKKNLLSKISSSAVMLTACLALITIVLPFGKITIDETQCRHCGRCVGKCPFHTIEDGTYDSEVNTLADDQHEPMNHI